jgi:hypothetical protein
VSRKPTSKKSAKKPTAKAAPKRASEPKARKTAPAAKTPRATRVPAFVVQRRYEDMHGVLVSTEPDRVFLSARAARAHADRLNLELRAVVNPFLAGWSSFVRNGEKTLRELIAEFGLPAPEVLKRHGREYAQWHMWWEDYYSDMTDAQRDAIWDVFGKSNWYEVQKTTLEG